MKRIQFIAASLIALGATALYVKQQRDAMKVLGEGQIALRDAVDAIDRKARAARAEQAALSARSETWPAPAPPAPPAANVVSPAQPPLAPSAEQGPDAAPSPNPVPPPEVYLAHIDNSFDAEVVDRTWSRDADASLKARFTARDTVECRSSMCRVVTDDEGVDAASEKIRQVVGNPFDEVWSGAYISHREESEQGRTQRVTYFFRKGVALPML